MTSFQGPRFQMADPIITHSEILNPTRSIRCVLRLLAGRKAAQCILYLKGMKVLKPRNFQVGIMIKTIGFYCCHYRYRYRCHCHCHCHFVVFVIVIVIVIIIIIIIITIIIIFIIIIIIIIIVISIIAIIIIIVIIILLCASLLYYQHYH